MSHIDSVLAVLILWAQGFGIQGGSKYLQGFRKTRLVADYVYEGILRYTGVHRKTLRIRQKKKKLTCQTVGF